MLSYHHSDDEGVTRRIDPATVAELPTSCTLIRGYDKEKSYSLKEIRVKNLLDISEFDVKFNFIKTKSQLARVVLNKRILITLPISDVITISSELIFNNIKIVDAKGKTKGQGSQGIVKRRGTKIKKRKHFRTAKKRLIGSQGNFTPGVTSWRVPMAGQLGNANRLVYNLKVLSNKYLGLPENSFYLKTSATLNTDLDNYVILKGSIPGPEKSIFFLRENFRK